MNTILTQTLRCFDIGLFFFFSSYLPKKSSCKRSSCFDVLIITSESHWANGKQRSVEMQL